MTDSLPTHLSPPTHPPTLGGVAKCLLAATLVGGAVSFLDWSMEDYKPLIAGGVGGCAWGTVAWVEQRKLSKKILLDRANQKIRSIAARSTTTPEQLVGLIQFQEELGELDER